MKREEKEFNSIKYKNKQQYRESYKLSAMLDLVTGVESDSFIDRKYGFGSGYMSNLKKESLEQNGFFRILEEMKNKAKPDNTSEDLAAQNAELKKALELSVMKVAALETLIDVVDDQLNIDIRKKGGSKQSN